MNRKNIGDNPPETTGKMTPSQVMNIGKAWSSCNRIQKMKSKLF
ncbi:hypothetical protein [Agriterribacter sp.]|nr:hypothetical protein [Agriterribacter sp.]HRP56252.1 hypothetical protein [Agriterribacter sp.]